MNASGDNTSPLSLAGVDDGAAKLLVAGLLAALGVIGLWLLGVVLALLGVCARHSWPRARRALRRGRLLASAPQPRPREAGAAPRERPPQERPRGTAVPRAALAAAAAAAAAPWWTQASPSTDEELALARSASPLSAADAAAHAAMLQPPPPPPAQAPQPAAHWRGVVFAHDHGLPGGAAARAALIARAAAGTEAEAVAAPP